MTRITKLAGKALAIGVFAVAALAPTSTAAANPMDAFVDCSDAFWAVTCTTDGDPEPAVIVGEPVAIDSDPVCVQMENGFFHCHS